MKKLWVLPLAALLCGRPVNPPRLKPALSDSKQPCETRARNAFLLAYAYRLDSPRESQRRLGIASQALRKCENTVLRSRIDELRKSLP